MIAAEILADKLAAIRTTLTERGLRLWAAAEARSLGHGGIKMMARITGLGRETVARGIKELSYSLQAMSKTKEGGNHVERDRPVRTHRSDG